MTLIERLEKATEGSRELDAEIATLVAGATMEMQPNGQPAYYRGGSWVSIGPVREYTTSIDDALTLVPEGWSWTLSVNPRDIGTFARVDNMGLKAEPNFNVHGNRPAPLALCIAALKARSHP